MDVNGLGRGNSLSTIASSVIAAKRANDTQINDPGIMTSKSDGTAIKTSEALASFTTNNLHDLTIEGLAALKYVSSGNKETRLAVKGYIRGQNSTTLLIEGGALSFIPNGYSGATGNLVTLLDGVFGLQDEDVDDGRRLGGY